MRQNKNRMPILMDGHPVVCGLGLDLLNQLIVSLDFHVIVNWGTIQMESLILLIKTTSD